MAKRRQGTKKGKSTTGSKSKAQKGKRAGGKRGAKSKASKKSTSSSSKKHGHTRRNKQKSPSKFNLFMKTTVQKIKQDQPGLTQKDAFKKAAEQWAASPENPNNIHH